jgi:CRISPR-associated protein Cas4
MHNTLKAFYERVKRYKQGLPEVNELPDIDDLLNIYESKWISQGYEGKKQEISRFKAGEQSLRRYYEQFFSEDENPIWLEERFQINMKDFWIKGVVDRLDRRRIGGEGDGQEGEGDGGCGLEIIDYKTGKVPSRSVKKNLQLALYAMAIERIKDEEVKKASLLYLSGPKKFEVDISKDRRKEAEEEVKEVLEELKKLNFKPDPGFLCRYCDYRNICDFADI